MGSVTQEVRKDRSRVTHDVREFTGSVTHETRDTMYVLQKKSEMAHGMLHMMSKTTGGL